MTTWYEWEVEEWDAPHDDDGAECLDHEAFDTYEEAARFVARGEGFFVAVLVRNSDADGRAWAYLKNDGMLPEWCTDAYGSLVARVPVRFHREIAKASIR